MKYSLSTREILRLGPEGFPDLSHNTDILNFKKLYLHYSIVLTGRAILKELIFRIGLAAGAIFSRIVDEAI